MTANGRAGNLRDVSTRRHRDPSGKAALFSHGAPPVTPGADDVLAGDDIEIIEETDARRAGTLVVECSACDARTRIGYVDFVLLNLPVGVWLPLPGLHFNRRMTCPACSQWTWLQAKWFA